MIPCYSSMAASGPYTCSVPTCPSLPNTAAILAKLGYERLDVLGYSMGAGVAFRLAVQHPNVARRLALVSAGFAQEGFYPELLPMQAHVGAAMADQMKETPMYKSYVAVARWRVCELRRPHYGWSARTR
jgi:pimeloyl-ACP methyl ester carboxylesterase